MKELREGGYLTKVKVDTKVMGMTVSSTTTEDGVMTTTQIADYLRNERGWDATGKSGGTDQDIQDALKSGQKVIVRYDQSSDGKGNNGHFGVVKWINVDPNNKHGGWVLVDSSAGTVYMPLDKFNDRWKATGNDIITGNPPKNNGYNDWWSAWF